MKRIITIVFAFSLAVSFMSCTTDMGEMKDGKSFVTEGWVTPHIFRVTSTGAPKDGLTNKIQRRGTAKEAALIMAQKRIIEKFVGAKLEVGAGVENYRSTGIAVAKEFGGVVKGGTIVKTVYDNDDNCEVIYQIEGKNLKSRVEGGATN